MMVKHTIYLNDEAEENLERAIRKHEKENIETDTNTSKVVADALKVYVSLDRKELGMVDVLDRLKELEKKNEYGVTIYDLWDKLGEIGDDDYEE